MSNPYRAVLTRPMSLFPHLQTERDHFYLSSKIVRLCLHPDIHLPVAGSRC